MNSQYVQLMAPARNSIEGMAKITHRRHTQLEHLCQLHIDDYKKAVLRQTGIICTLGPATHEVPILKEMLETGMNIARLNFSHGTYEYHAETIANLRKAWQQTNRKHTVAIALDTKGPEIRTGVLEKGANTEIELKRGAHIVLTTKCEYAEKCSEKLLFVDYKNIIKVLDVGKKIFIDDGLICLKVLKIEEKVEAILCEVENGGSLGSRKGVNLPGTLVDLPAVTEKDKADLKFGIEQGIDIVFASFSRTVAGIQDVRKALGKAGEHIKVIAKIENEEGVQNADAIIREADGIMVARGDLGIEIPPEQVFLVQKTLTAKCNRVGKPVICATQMLESMIYKPRPTRAESSDVANAVLDGVDCVMLSGETAKGSYPIEALRMMHQLCREAESAMVHSRYFDELVRSFPKPTDMAQTIAIAATSAVESCYANAIICVTNNGRAARMISHCRPPVPIYAVTSDLSVARQLHLHRGVLPIYYENGTKQMRDRDEDLEARLCHAIELGIECGFMSHGDMLVVVTGASEGDGRTNALRVMEAP